MFHMSKEQASFMIAMFWVGLVMSGIAAIGLTAGFIYVLALGVKALMA